MSVIFGLEENTFDQEIVAYPCKLASNTQVFLLRVCVAPWEERSPVSIGRFEDLCQLTSYDPLLRALFRAFGTAELMVLLDPIETKVLSYTWRWDVPGAERIVFNKRRATTQFKRST